MPVVVVLWYLVPVWDRLSFATTVAVDAFGRHGATHDLAQWGVSRRGRESVMAMGEFCQNAIGPPEWVRGHGFRGVGTVCYLCRVYLNLSMAASSVTVATRE